MLKAETVCDRCEVIEGDTDTINQSKLPQMPYLENEISVGGLRLLLLPPGQVNLQISLQCHLIDVNLNATMHALALNSDKFVDDFVPADSIGFWPKNTSVKIITKNRLPGAVLEIDDATMARWFDSAEIEDGQRDRFQLYKRDAVAADIGRAAITYLTTAANKDSGPDRLTVEALALGLGARIMARMNAKDGDPDAEFASWSRRGDARRVRLATDWAESNLFDPALTVADMAAAACLSACHFGAVFKSTTGQTPYEFILSRRAQFAKDLIVGTDDPLADIAYQSGFSSQAHMTTIIKRFFSLTPRQLRRAV